MRRGFTLIEMAYVIAVIGLLSAITVPSYDFIVRRAYAAEAHATIQALAQAEVQHFRDTGSYLACEASGPIPVGPVTWPAQDCWEALHVEVTDTVRYRYGVTVADGSFVVTAEGDLDRDGTLARFSLDGRNLHVDIEQELE